MFRTILKYPKYNAIENNNVFNIILLYFLFIVIIIVANINVPIAIGLDPANGFMTLKSYLNGSAHFNYLEFPDINSINQNTSEWQSWWSPGQYAIPSFFSHLFKISIGDGTLITIIFFSIFSLFGYFKMFLHFKFSHLTAILSICIISSQRYFLMPFSIYNGGEVLLMGFVPWSIIFLDQCFSKSSLSLLIICTFGIFLKLSFFITMTSILFYLFLRSTYSIKRPLTALKLRGLIKIFLKLSIIFLSIFILIYINKEIGNNSSPSNSNNFNPIVMDFLIPLAAPFVSAFGIDDFITKFVDFKIQKSGWYSVNGLYSHHPEYFYIPILFILILIIYHIQKIPSIRNSNYLKLFMAFYIVHLTMFTYLYTFNAYVSYESRHHRTVGILLIPLYIEFITHLIRNKSKLHMLISKIHILFIITFAIYGIYGFTNRKNYIRNNSVYTNNGFAQLDASSKLISKLLTLEDSFENKNSLFYCYSSNLATEINKNRVLYFDDDFISTDDIKKRKIQGRVANLFVIYPCRFNANGKSLLLRKCFVNHTQFQLIFNDGKYEILHSTY